MFARRPDAPGSWTCTRAVLHLGMDDARERLEGHVLLCDLSEVGEPRGAPRAVAAHLGLAPVGVEEPPLEVRLPGGNDHDQAVGAHRVMPVADGHRQLLQVHPLEDGLAVVDQDEIVPAALHFIERYFLHGYNLIAVMTLETQAAAYARICRDSLCIRIPLTLPATPGSFRP